MNKKTPNKFRPREAPIMKEKVPNKTHTREPKVNDKSPNKTRMREKGNLPWPLSSEVLTQKKDDE